jgi:hypothetical protein
MTRGIVAAIAMLLPLAASNAQTSSGATATPTVHKSYDQGVGFGKGTRQEYHLLPGGTCKGKKKLAVFSWITGASKTVSIPAGVPVTMWTLTTHFTAGLNTFCQHAATFTPKPGGRYDLALRTQVWSGCQMAITEASASALLSTVNFRPDIECRKVKDAKPIAELLRPRR